MKLETVLAICFILAAAMNYKTEAKVTVCEPFLKIQRNCDLCECSADGSFLSCRSTECSPGTVPMGTVRGQADTVCRAGGFFQAECNHCQCSQLGNDISCTKKLCV